MRSIRAWLEMKDGTLWDTLELLEQPDEWENLIPADRRLIKRYAAEQIVIVKKPKGEPMKKNTVRIEISKPVWDRFRAMVAGADNRPILRESWRAFPYTRATFEGMDLTSDAACAEILRDLLGQLGNQADSENQKDKSAGA
jgi:hypothetical protein